MPLIPAIMMIAMVLGHTIAIQFIKKKREALDSHASDTAAKKKTLNLIIAILYIEIPIITAIIWFVVAPALNTTSN